VEQCKTEQFDICEAPGSVAGTSVLMGSVMLICASSALLLLLVNIIKVASELKCPCRLADPNSTFPRMLYLWKINISVI